MEVVLKNISLTIMILYLILNTAWGLEFDAEDIQLPLSSSVNRRF